MEFRSKADKFITQLLSSRTPETCIYHTLEHTRMVVERVDELALALGLTEEQHTIVCIAAWFHDSGFTIERENHENESCRIAREFCEENNLPEKLILEVEKCIQSTKLDAEPQSELSKVLIDADVSHTGHVDFMEWSNLFRKEMKAVKGETFNNKDYWKETLSFLQKIRFRTDYAKKNWEENRLENILKVEKKLLKMSEKKDKAPKAEPVKKNTARGVESMFRVTARNQISLSSIADNKANIMISINAILIPGLVSLRSLIPADSMELIIPAIILILFCLCSLIFAVLSVRPTVSAGKFSQKDIEKKSVNLLFFGNFYKVPYKEYESAMLKMMDDYDFLYSTMINDQFNLGKVLAHKYKLLTTAYNFFLVGFILSTLITLILYFF